MIKIVYLKCNWVIWNVLTMVKLCDAIHFTICTKNSAPLTCDSYWFFSFHSGKLSQRKEFQHQVVRTWVMLTPHQTEGMGEIINTVTSYLMELMSCYSVQTHPLRMKYSGVQVMKKVIWNKEINIKIIEFKNNFKL